MKEPMYVVRNDSGQYYNVDDNGNDILTFAAGEIFYNLSSSKRICNQLNAKCTTATFKVYEVKLELVG
jgi:hypothetical protein